MVHDFDESKRLDLMRSEPFAWDIVDVCFGKRDLMLVQFINRLNQDKQEKERLESLLLKVKDPSTKKKLEISKVELEH